MKSKSIWNVGPVTCGIGDVVSLRAVTYSVAFHQWLRSGSFASRTLPTTCVYSCSVSRVSCHAESGIEGQLPMLVAAMDLPLAPRPVLLLVTLGRARTLRRHLSEALAHAGRRWDDVAHTNGGLAMS